MTFISLLTAVVIQKGKFLPACFLIKDFLCDNGIFWRGILQPQDIALLSEGGARSDPETEISSTLSSPLLRPLLGDSLPCEHFQKQMWQSRARPREPLLSVLSQPLVPEQHSLHGEIPVGEVCSPARVFLITWR